MDLNLLTTHLQETLPSLGFRLISVAFVHEEGEQLLRIIVDKYHHHPNLDEIVSISEALNAYLDGFPDEKSYTLDVTTLGAEKEISINEISDYIGEYVTLTLGEGVKGPPILKGKLQEVNSDNVSLNVNDRGKMKLHVIPLTTIKKINRAIK